MNMSQTNSTPSMSLDTLKKSDVWLRLSKQQQTLLTEFLALGLAQGNYDIVAAVKVAYPGIAPKNRAVWLRRLEHNPKIRAVLALYFGDSDLVVTLKEIKMLLARTKRKGAPLAILKPFWNRAAAALEEIASKSNTPQELSKDAT
jgi:hypothetical protein